MAASTIFLFELLFFDTDMTAAPPQQKSRLLKAIDPGLQFLFRHASAETLAVQPCAAAREFLHVGAASADAASAGCAEGDHSDSIKVILLDKGIHVERLLLSL